VAVYTDLTDEDLDALLAQYDLGRALTFKGVAEGVENSNFLLETEAGRFFLTLFEKRVARDDLPFFMAVMERLAQAGINAPLPIRRRDGAVLSESRGKPCVIITFLHGVSPKRPKAGQCKALGETLGRMHLALADFGHARPNVLSVGAWRGLIMPRLALAERLRAGLDAEIVSDLADLEARWPQDLPSGVIHADLFPDNALFLGDELSGVIDFYFACRDALAYDLAVCLNSWCFEADRSFNLTKGRALIAGYESARALVPEERAALPLLCRGAAMRFFATRLADWAETPPGALVRPKDPLEYADKLAFHRGATRASDYGA
jgi:homoserine kinase type II